MKDFMGMPVVVTADYHNEVPNMQLSPGVCAVLTPAMVADHNAWMREFFGTHTETWNTVADDTVLRVLNPLDGRPTLYMNQRTHDRLEREIRKARLDHYMRPRPLFDYRG